MYFSSHEIMISSWFRSIIPLSFLKTIEVSFFIRTSIFQTEDPCPLCKFFENSCKHSESMFYIQRTCTWHFTCRIQGCILFSNLHCVTLIHSCSVCRTWQIRNKNLPWSSSQKRKLAIRSCRLKSHQVKCFFYSLTLHLANNSLSSLKQHYWILFFNDPKFSRAFLHKLFLFPRDVELHAFLPESLILSSIHHLHVSMVSVLVRATMKKSKEFRVLQRLRRKLIKYKGCSELSRIKLLGWLPIIVFWMLLARLNCK